MNDRTPTEEMIAAGLEHYAEGGCMGLSEDERREVVCSILAAALAASPPAPAAEAVAYRYHHARYDGWFYNARRPDDFGAYAIQPLYPHPLDAAAIRAEALADHVRLLNQEADRLLFEAGQLPPGYEQDSRSVSMTIEARALYGAASALGRLADKGEAEGWTPNAHCPETVTDDQGRVWKRVLPASPAGGRDGE